MTADVAAARRSSEKSSVRMFHQSRTCQLGPDTCPSAASWPTNISTCARQTASWAPLSLPDGAQAVRCARCAR
ncbi:hypothetical protein EEB18_002065 [Sphingopyxis sp. OPL5]|nr:hypothetical protein EEB18_002065 [Sphingopyxis sp. OPL5]